MTEKNAPLFQLEAMLAEIAEDEKVDRAARRLLSQADIQRLIEESRRRREVAVTKASQP